MHPRPPRLPELLEHLVEHPLEEEGLHRLRRRRGVHPPEHHLGVGRFEPGLHEDPVLLLEDEHGLANVIVYPDLYSEQRHIVRGEPFVAIQGILRHQANTINLLAERLWPLAEARAEFTIPGHLEQSDIRAINIITQQGEDTDPALGHVRRIAPSAHNYR